MFNEGERVVHRLRGWTGSIMYQTLKVTHHNKIPSYRVDWDVKAEGGRRKTSWNYREDYLIPLSSTNWEELLLV